MEVKSIIGAEWWHCGLSGSELKYRCQNNWSKELFQHNLFRSLLFILSMYYLEDILAGVSGSTTKIFCVAAKMLEFPSLAKLKVKLFYTCS